MPTPDLEILTDNHQLGLSGAGLANLEAKLQTFASIDLTPVVEAWEVVLHDDNRRGLEAGLDGEGKPLEPVTYRPKAVKSVDMTILPHNNLTRSRYRSLSGPPLIPRGLQSRAITNYRTASAKLPSGDYAAVGAWEEILDVNGEPFLSAHFEGKNGLPIRDLRGVRPQALAEATEALRDFLSAFLSAHPQAGPPPSV